MSARQTVRCGRLASPPRPRRATHSPRGIGVGEDGPVAVSDRTRKILWSRSGGRCALCRKSLVVDETPVSVASVVGEEAHLVAQSPGGPRYTPLPDNAVDDIDNLVLLCRVDHKRIDDQVEEFPCHCLREMRTRHEQWVKGLLDLADNPGEATKRDQPDALQVPALLTGAAVWSVIAGAQAYDFHGVEEPDVATAALRGLGRFPARCIRLGRDQRGRSGAGVHGGSRRKASSGFTFR